MLTNKNEMLKWKQQNEQTIPFSRKSKGTLVVVISVIFAWFWCVSCVRFFIVIPKRTAFLSVCLPACACRFVCWFPLSLLSHMYNFQQINTNAMQTLTRTRLLQHLWLIAYILIDLWWTWTNNRHRFQCAFLPPQLFLLFTGAGFFLPLFFSISIHCAIAYYIDIGIDLCLSMFVARLCRLSCVTYRAVAVLTLLFIRGGLLIQLNSVWEFRNNRTKPCVLCVCVCVSILLLCFNSIVKRNRYDIIFNFRQWEFFVYI